MLLLLGSRLCTPHRLTSPPPPTPLLSPFFFQAGESLAKCGDAAGCVDRYRQAVAIYLEAGRWNQCGNMSKTIGEM